MPRPLLLLIPPVSVEADAASAMATLVAWVTACRQRGRDVRLRLSRGKTAAEEAEAALAEDVEVAVVTLAAGDPADDRGGRALLAALLAALCARAVPLASDVQLSAGDTQRLASLAARAAAVTTVKGGVDVSTGAPAAMGEPALRRHADACLRRAHVDLEAEMFAGNDLACRNADLIEIIVP